MCTSIILKGKGKMKRGYRLKPILKLLNSNINNNRSKLLRLFWDIVVFRLVAYSLNMICLILQILYKILHIYTFWYNFDTVLYQFLETGTSDRTFVCLNQLLRFSGFSLYPLSFFLYSPFNTEQLEEFHWNSGLRFTYGIMI